jgi:hypothetical protein
VPLQQKNHSGAAPVTAPVEVSKNHFDKHLLVSLFSDVKRCAAWDCSAWVRTYGLFLEERLECFRVLKYDVEAERLSKQGQGPEKVCSYHFRIASMRNCVPSPN